MTQPARHLRRVAITGMGIVSCLGNDLPTVSASLREQRSGIAFVPEYAEKGFLSQVAGIPDTSALPAVPRKWNRFMAAPALYAHHACSSALQDAGLLPEQLRQPRAGVVLGSAACSFAEFTHMLDTMHSKGARKVLPYSVPRIMNSSASAVLSTMLGMQGISVTVSSACASAGHAMGMAADLIRCGRQDIMLSGGSDEVAWTITMPFDAMGALATARKDSTASRPYDAQRDGFVIAGGAGVLVLEEMEHARRRGARIYAELAGVGYSSDGVDMISPSPDGAAYAMRDALHDADCASLQEVDYINAHGTSTPIGDISELQAIGQVFGTHMPLISSTKGLSGHSLGAAAAHELIYSVLMLQEEFLAGCAHVEQLDPACADYRLLLSNRAQRIDALMSNSFGFGGTNVSLLLRRLAH